MFSWLRNAYWEVFPFDGYDPVDNTLFGKPITVNGVENPAVTAHKNSLYIQIAAFFNFPSQLRKDTPPGLLSSLKSWFLWPDDPEAGVARKMFSVITGILLTPFRLLSIVGGTLIHILALVTELFPLAMQNLCKEKFGDDSAGAGFFGFLHFIGRAITSPIEGMRMTFAEPGWRGWVKAGLSAGVTFIIYAALAPLLLPLAFNFVLTHAPTALLMKVASYAYLPIDLLLSYATPALLTLMGPTLSVSLAMSTVGLNLAFLITVPLNLLNKLANISSNAIHGRSAAVIVTEPLPASTVSGVNTLNMTSALGGEPSETTPLIVLDSQNGAPNVITDVPFTAPKEEEKEPSNSLRISQ